MEALGAQPGDTTSISASDVLFHVDLHGLIFNRAHFPADDIGLVLQCVCRTARVGVRAWYGTKKCGGVFWPTWPPTRN